MKSFAELARRPELLDLAALGRRRDDEPAVDHAEASVGVDGLAVEVDRAR